MPASASGRPFAMANPIETLERRQLRPNIPQFKAGDTVRVHFQVIEGERRRIQVFEGIVIKRQGSGVRETFTVRKQSFGVGVERTFPLHSPKIEKIEVAAIGDVNRAKLYYLRGRVGKKARVRERREGQRLSSADAVRRRRAAARRRRAACRPSGLLRARRRRKPPRSSPRNRARRLLRFDRQLGLRFVAGVDEAGRGCLAGPLVVAGVLLDYECLRDHRVRPLAAAERLEAVTARGARGALPAVVALRDVVHRPRDLAGGDRPERAASVEPRGDALAACARSRRRPRPVSSTASGSARPRPSTWPSSTATSGARRSRPPRSWRRSCATGRCAGWTRSSRTTASPRTSATSRRAHSAVVRERGPSEIHRRSFQALCYRRELVELEEERGR